jgi:hypothetical protein
MSAGVLCGADAVIAPAPWSIGKPLALLLDEVGRVGRAKIMIESLLDLDDHAHVTTRMLDFLVPNCNLLVRYALKAALDSVHDPKKAAAYSASALRLLKSSSAVELVSTCFDDIMDELFLLLATDDRVDRLVFRQLFHVLLALEGYQFIGKVVADDLAPILLMHIDDPAIMECVLTLFVKLPPSLKGDLLSYLREHPLDELFALLTSKRPEDFMKRSMMIELVHSVLTDGGGVWADASMKVDLLAELTLPHWVDAFLESGVSCAEDAAAAAGNRTRAGAGADADQDSSGKSALEVVCAMLAFFRTDVSRHFVSASPAAHCVILSCVS